MFWKTNSPYFVNNLKKRSKITLVDEKDNPAGNYQLTIKTLE